jgi:hypothetical protein
LQDPTKFTQKWDFWFENMSSGNPEKKKMKKSFIFGHFPFFCLTPFSEKLQRHLSPAKIAGFNDPFHKKSVY